MNDRYKTLHCYTGSYAHHRLFHNSQVQDSFRKGRFVLFEETVAYFGQHYYQPLVSCHEFFKCRYHLLSHIHWLIYPISAITAVGRVLSIDESASNICSCERPLIVVVAQPKDANLAARSPSSSELEWLLIAIQVRLESCRLPASKIASQMLPSLHSPSPIRANTRRSLFLIRSASAMPTAIERPCPSEPVEASTPGTWLRSGCDPRILSYPINVLSAEAGKKSLSTRIA